MAESQVFILVLLSGILLPFEVCGIWCTIVTIIKLHNMKKKDKESTDEDE